MKTWFIEDAGGGCRAFSEVVVLVSERPKETYTAKIPLTWSGGESLEEVVCKKIVDLMDKAGVTKEDKVLVCSGNIFHGLHAWLKENEYNWEFAKMEGLAHNIAEEEFNKQIVKAGFPSHIKLLDRNYRDFYRLVEKWVMEQKAGQRYMKDRLVRQKPVETRYILKANHARTLRCSGCQKKILPYTPVVEFKVRQDGKRIKKNYHPDCSPVTPFKNKLKKMTGKINATAIEGLVAPCRKEAVCPVCNGQLTPGEEAFYGYLDTKLLTGHKNCFTGTSVT